MVADNDQPAHCTLPTQRQAEQVQPEEYLADRCLHLHVNEMGDVVWASNTPKALFNIQVCV